MNYTLSNQAIGAIMMALQNSLMDQTDIVPVLKGFEIQINEGSEIEVANPPVVRVKEDIETSVQ
tara:strand:+ start:302 stop:493 length:192 start_codon:yes stop_codon:yes gene_type:complete